MFPVQKMGNRFTYIKGLEAAQELIHIRRHLQASEKPIHAGAVRA